MGLRVNTNIASINAQRNTAQVTARLQHNFQRLSTGLRIATAADDAAGLAICVRLLDGSSSTVQFQVGINSTSGIDVLNVSLTPALATSLSLNSLDIGSGGDFSTAIGAIDTAINAVSSLRGSFGALQNRLQSTI